MSGNQKQPATGGPQTQRFANSTYAPILTQPQNNYAGTDGYPAASPYVSQTQGPNQGPGLRNIPSGPPNQSSTPPNTDLKVPNLSGPPPMQFVPTQTVRSSYFPRGGGAPPAQTPRMPNQQHRAQGAQQYSPSPPYIVQSLYLPGQSQLFYPVQRTANSAAMLQQSFGQQPVFSHQVPYPGPVQPAGSGYSYQIFNPMYQSQTPAMPIATRPVAPAAAAPPNTSSGTIPNTPMINPQGLAPANYSRNQKQRRPNALKIIDPDTGEDKLNEIFNADTSHPTSGESSARQTPQPMPPIPNREVQAAFAKQVAQTLTEDDKPHQHVSTVVVEPPPFHDIAIPPDIYQHPPPPITSLPPMQTGPRYDVQNSNLQYDAKEFVSIATKQQQQIKESTPIVSANSDAAEVVPKRGSPEKSRKQVGPRSEIKVESVKEFQPKENDCDRSPSINKEDVAPVPQNVVSTQSVVESVVESIKEAADKKGAKKQPIPVETKTSEISEAASVEGAAGKSKGSKNKNIHNQNGKPAATAQQQPPVQTQQTSAAVPAPQPPKATNRSTKTKELNQKGANKPNFDDSNHNLLQTNLEVVKKEGTDMDAFSEDNSGATVEINANIVNAKDITRVVSSDVVNANPIPQTEPQVDVPLTVETDTVISEVISNIAKIDSNDNVTTMKATNEDTLPNTNTAPTQAAPPLAKPVSKPVFDVTSIIKEAPPPPFPTNENRDETDRAIPNDKIVLAKNDVNNKLSMENSLNEAKPALPYKPGQWAPDKPDGIKVYEKDFLLALRDHPISKSKQFAIIENILLDDRNNRQADGGRHSMVGSGRNDYNNPSYQNNYGGKSGSQRGGTLPKRNSQSGKMGSRGGDKGPNKPLPKVSISLRGDVKLHESENAWKPARLNTKAEKVTEDEKKTAELYKKVRAVLNKLTPQKFDTLVNQVRLLQIDNKERLQGVIDLVFDKAIDEPNFALAYAMMCKEIQNMQVSIGDEKKNLAFRTLLITRCQIEFEKQSVDETERNAKVKEIEGTADIEKKKELQFELEEYDRRLRMKSVGCIRFIGELFKQQMLTASIMKRCLQSLLTNGDEESLECLCKLLTTVGKELESKKNDLGIIFDEMKKISTGKAQKVSSRIRFMLQDVIDLRDSKWVPRRGDTNPKTIDQIQKEAETEQFNIHAMNSMNPQHKDMRSGSGGQRGGGSRQKVNDDGWTMSPASNRGSRSQFSFQSDKMKAATKLPTTDEMFGSSQSYIVWGKGAMGAKVPSTTTNNMYSALENAAEIERRPLNSRGSKDSYSSKGPSMERNIYKNYDGRGSRSGSQHRDSSTPMRSTGAPPSGAMLPPSSMPLKPQTYQQPASQQPAAPAPTPAAAPAVTKLTEDQIQRRLKNSLDEYLGGFLSPAEYFQDTIATVPSSDFYKVVFESYNSIMEKSQTVRLKTGELFAKLIKSGSISVDDYCRGFEELLSGWEDLVIDIPQIWLYFAEQLVHLLYEEVLPIRRLHKLLDNLIAQNVAKKLLKPLFSLVVKEKGPNFLQNSWESSGLQFSDFMPSSEVQSFLQESDLEFLLGGGSPVGQGTQSYESIQAKLSEFLQNKASFDEIVNWITANVGDRVTENKFIRALATAIFENSICKNKLQSEVLLGHCKLIQKYVDNNVELELQLLYALQLLINRLEHPSGLLLAICDTLYGNSTLCQESFTRWENSNDPAEQEGKGVALKQMTSFFTQLRENEEEDEYSSNSEEA